MQQGVALGAQSEGEWQRRWVELGSCVDEARKEASVRWIFVRSNLSTHDAWHDQWWRHGDSSQDRTRRVVVANTKVGCPRKDHVRRGVLAGAFIGRAWAAGFVCMA
jgi:hypothetical protein